MSRLVPYIYSQYLTHFEYETIELLMNVVRKFTTVNDKEDLFQQCAGSPNGRRWGC